MIKKHISFFLFFLCSLFGLALQAESNNIQLITGAPTGAPDEPIYGNDFSPSVDWFSEPINGNYYFAALAPNAFGVIESKTIAIYRFIPGNPLMAGSLEFIASAPTGQCIFDQFTQQDVCDNLDNNSFIPTSVSWFPSDINGEFFFTVTGISGALLESRLGLPSQQRIRVYRFNPNGTSPIEFIDSAPLQASENEPPFDVPESVDWFSELIGNKAYFSVVGGSGDRPQVRVYSFDSSAPLGTNLSFVGAAADGITAFDEGPFSVDWLPDIVGGNFYFAVGGESNRGDPIRVYQFCPDGCTGTAPLPENNIQLITTAPTGDRLDIDIERANAVEWLVVDGRYYLAAAVIEEEPSPFTQRTIRIYEFIPGKDDPTQGILRFVISAPTGRECCVDQIVDDNFRFPNSLDWLAQDGRYFLVVGGGIGEDKRSLLDSNSIRIYEFDTNKEKLLFIAAEELLLDVALSVDWFPGLIDKNSYFAAGIRKDSRSGSEDKEVNVYKFRPPCTFAGLSCRNQEEVENEKK